MPDNSREVLLAHTKETVGTWRTAGYEAQARAVRAFVVGLLINAETTTAQAEAMVDAAIASK